MTEEKRATLKANVEDLVGSLFYYDRKEDDELTVNDMENLTEDDLNFICETFVNKVKED